MTNVNNKSYISYLKTQKMKKEKQQITPYSPESYATEPSGFVKFLRVEPCRQIFNFFWLNYKIMRIVTKGHGK